MKLETDNINGLRCVSLEEADINEALKLVREVHWNQTADDWKIFLDLGRVYGAREASGQIVASAAILPLGTEFGWISMVLVTQAWRHKGVATCLLKNCVRELLALGLVPGLDATPTGQALYRKLGFADGWKITRWYRPAGVWNERHVSRETVHKGTLQDIHRINQLDRQAFGGARSRILDGLMRRMPAFMRVVERRGECAGFLLGRDGSDAVQLGPLAAHDRGAAEALLADALNGFQLPIYIDVLDCHQEIAAWLRSAGFSPQRPFTRMLLHREQSFGDARYMFAIGGPEIG